MSLLSICGIRLRTGRTFVPRYSARARGLQSPIARVYQTSARLAASGVFAVMMAGCGGGSDPIVPIATVTVSPPTTTVAFGGTTQLAANTLDAGGAVLGGRAVTWSTSNASVATVAAGLVTGVSTGTATITATSEGKSGFATITVSPPPVASVTVTPANPTISEIDTLRLTAQLRATDNTVLTGRTVTWSSATPTVATVNANGRVTGISPGTTVVTATSEGKSGTVTVTVTISACNISIAKPIGSGTPISGTLAPGDCPWEYGTWADVYTFTLPARTNIEVRMRSTAFDAYLYTVSRNDKGELFFSGENDDDADVAKTTDSKILATLEAGTHYIVANSLDSATGPYTVSLAAPYIPTVVGTSSAPVRTGTIKPARASAFDAQRLRALMRRFER